MCRQLDPRVHEWARHERIIAFDGVCNWCTAWVNFAIAHDPRRTFKFGTLQSNNGQQVLKHLQRSTEDFDTFLLIENGRVFTKSTAALRIVRRFSGLWPLCYLGIALPRPFRDAVYDYVVRRRYRWMGKSTACRVATPDERGRFV